MTKFKKEKLIFYSFFVSTSFCLFTSLSFSVHSTLLLTTNLLGGGYAFNNETTSYGAKIYFSVIPAVKWKNNLLIPFYSFEYSGVKDVKELVGGGTFIQQCVTNTIYIKPIFKLTNMVKLKPKIAFTSQLFKETMDEEWTKGLFDYYKQNVSLETEFCFTKISKLSFTLSGYDVNFYNYQTLASKKLTEEYGKELTSVGKDILNFYAAEGTIDYKINEYISLNLYTTQKYFVDQYVITENAEYSKTKRQDNLSFLNVNLNYPIKPLGKTTIFSSLAIQYTVNNSNQNHYDVEHTKFVKDYYDYNETSFSPQIKFAFNTIPLNLQVNYTISYRQYIDRLVQDEQGNYKDDKTFVLSQYLSLVLSFPIVENLNGVIQQNYFVSSSNMKYEQVYRYNYNAYNLLVGISYEF